MQALLTTGRWGAPERTAARPGALIPQIAAALIHIGQAAAASTGPPDGHSCRQRYIAGLHIDMGVKGFDFGRQLGRSEPWSPNPR